MPKQFRIVGEDGEEIIVSESVVDFLIGLNTEGVDQLKDTVRFVQTVKTMSKIGRWIVMGFLAMTGAVLSIWTGVRSVFGSGAH